VDPGWSRQTGWWLGLGRCSFNAFRVWYHKDAAKLAFRQVVMVRVLGSSAYSGGGDAAPGRAPSPCWINSNQLGCRVVDKVNTATMKRVCLPTQSVKEQERVLLICSVPLCLPAIYLHESSVLPSMLPLSQFKSQVRQKNDDKDNPYSE